MIARLKDRRDKEHVHLTKHKPKIKASLVEDTIVFHKDTLLLEDEIVMLVNFMIKIINNVSIIVNKYSEKKYEILNDFCFSA